MTKLHIYTLLILSALLFVSFSSSHEGYKRCESQIDDAVIHHWRKKYQEWEKAGKEQEVEWAKEWEEEE